MKAMIFAAGIGSRLKPWTNSHPKALVEVGGDAMLGNVINKIKNAGIRYMVVNTHHFAKQIEEYLDNHTNFGIDIYISDETNLLLDTGGGLRKAARQLTLDDEPVILHNADIFTDFPILDMAAAHIEQGNDATLLVDIRETSRYLLFDENMRMKGWTNKKTSEVRPANIIAENYKPMAFGGVHILSTSMIKLIEEQYAPDEPFSIIDFYIANCEKHKIAGFTPYMPYKWHDIGKPESLEAAIAEIK